MILAYLLQGGRGAFIGMGALIRINTVPVRIQAPSVGPRVW